MRNINSLKNYSEFQDIYSARNSKANKYLVLYKAEGTGKIGISVSKKVGNSVVRHRVTRLIREAYRLNKEEIRKDKDIIVVARPLAKGQGYTEIESALLHLCKLQHLLIENRSESYEKNND